jgi:hypothetical protein
LIVVGLPQIELDLVVDDRHALEELRGHSSGVALPLRPAAAIDAPPEPFAGPVDRARRGGDAEHEHVRVGEAHRLRDRVLVLQQEDVRRLARDAVQLAPDGEQVLRWRREIAERNLEARGDLGAARRERPPDRVVVADAATAVLEVGFEQRSHLSGLRPPLL